MKHTLKKSKLESVFRNLVLLLISAAFLFPLYWMLCLSFKPAAEAVARPFNLPTSLYLENFKTVFQEVDIVSGMVNSFLYSFTTATIATGFSAMAAYAIFRMRKRSGPSFYRYFMIGLSVPGMCLVVPVFLIMKQLGIIGTFWAVIVPTVTGNLATGILMLGAFMKSLPHELEEASAIDGCTAFGCFCKIVLPMITPSLATRFVLVFLAMWNDYSSFKIFCLGSSRQPITLMVASFFNDKYATDWGMVGALLLVSSLPSVVLYCLCNKQLENAMTVGSLSK